MSGVKNIPEIKIGVVAVSRDCFPASLAVNRRKAVIEAYIKKYGSEDIYECPITIVESEIDMVNALGDVKKNGCNALCVYLGNFGPEIAESLLAKHFDGPVMFSAAAEESQNTLGIQGRGDAYCGMLNASYNLAIRNTRAWIPENPVRDAEGIADKQSAMLDKFAAYEATLLDWIDEHIGYRKYAALATKCWPAFEDMFKFVPCFVNSRLTGRGIPVSCEVDIYGALSEYIGWCISGQATTLLDINNSVPKDMYEESIKGKFPYDYKLTDVFMGFHCGNTCSNKLVNPHIGYQQIMANTHPQEWCDGTMEGDIQPGSITFYRVQSTADAELRAYIAQGEVLPVATRSFGSIGVFAIREMGRFYRYELIGNHYPHHGAVMFGHYGKSLYDALIYIGLAPNVIGWNRPAGNLHEGENPWGTI